MERVKHKEEFTGQIVDKISFLKELDGSTTISEDNCQLIICATVAVWAVRRKDDGRFLAKIGVSRQDETNEDTWTQNWRDSIVLTEKLKAEMIVKSFCNAKKYEAVLLIYHVAPLFESQSKYN